MAKKPIAPKKKLPTTILDDGAGLMEVARKQTGMTKSAAKLAKDGIQADAKKPKEIPSPNAKRWLDKVRRSEKMKKPFLEDCERFWRMYQGDYSFKPNRRKNFDTISVNFVYAHIEVITPSVFSGFPYIKVRPKPKTGESAKEAEVRARNMELVLNYWFKELAVDEELHDVFLDTFFGPAMVELGWETEIEEEHPTAEPAEGEVDPAAAADGLGASGIPEPTVRAVKDRPFIMRRDFKDFYFDPDAKRRKDSRWIGIQEVMTWNAFLASPKYTEKAKKKLKPQYYPQGQIDGSEDEKNWMNREDTRSDREWVKIYTIWDKDNKKVYSVAEGYEFFVNTDDAEGAEWPYEIDYKSDPFPFACHDAKRDRCSPYTWSEFKAGEPQIIEMNRIRSAIQVHVKTSLPKYIYTDAAGKRSMVNKLMQARSDEAVQLDNLDAIREFKVADIPKPLFEFNNMSRDDLTTVMGTSQYEQGSLADTATEASILEGRSQARKSMRSRAWEQYVVEIAAKLAQLCQQNMDEQLAVQIAGPNGIEWLNVTPEEIQGEFYFDIEPGIMEYKNEALRKQQLLKFYEISRGSANANERGILTKVAQEFELDPTEVITPENEMPKAPPPEPSISFKDIDPSTVTDPRVKNSIVIAALKQNGVPMTPDLEAHLLGIEPPPPMPPMPGGPQGTPVEPGGEPPAISGKGSSDGAFSPNGDPSAPPVAGNLTEGLGSV